MPNPPALFLLADRILDGGIEKFLRDRRDDLERPVAWERIARELADLTDRTIDVRGVTVQDWYDRYLAPVEPDPKAKTA